MISILLKIETILIPLRIEKMSYEQIDRFEMVADESYLVKYGDKEIATIIFDHYLDKSENMTIYIFNPTSTMELRLHTFTKNHTFFRKI